MFAILKLMVVLALGCGGLQTAAADEASEAVQMLSKLWKGNSDNGSGSQFLGNHKTFKLRTVTQTDDGSHTVITSEAPFQLLTIPDSPLSSIWERCSITAKCVLVACLSKRECIVQTDIEHDPIYQDPRREPKHYFKRTEVGGYVDPADAQSVRQALRTLIRLNTASPFDSRAPQ